MRLMFAGHHKGKRKRSEHLHSPHKQTVSGNCWEKPGGHYSLHFRLVGLAPETTSGAERLTTGVGEMVTGLGGALGVFRGDPAAGAAAACRVEGGTLACG